MSAKKFGFLEAAMMKLTKRKAAPDKEADKYEAALKENPNNVEALNALGDIYAKQGDNEKAREYYVKAGRLFAQDGFTLKAIAVYKKAQRAKPDSPDIYVELANLYVQKGLIGEAKASYLSGAELLNQSGATKASLDVYRKVIDLDPDNLNIRLKLADLYKKNNFPEEAAALYLSAARSYIGNGMLREGTELYKTALEIHPGTADTQFELASLYFDQGLLEEGLQILEKLRQHYLADSSVLERIGEVCLQIGKPDQAIVIYQTLAERDPTNKDYQDKLVQLSGSDRPVQEGRGEPAEPTWAHDKDALSEWSFQTEETPPAFKTPPPREEETFPRTPTPSEKKGVPESLSEVDLPEGVSLVEVAPEEAATPSSPSSSSSEYFDLAARLDSSLKISHEYEEKPAESPSEARLQIKIDSTNRGALSDNVGDVIREFKKSVLEEVGEEDYETHYELGIAYKEMNLLDDAIEEFKLAALSPAKYMESCSMIALCFAEKGNYDQAIVQLNEGLAKKGYEPEQYLNLRYELALIYETASQPNQALNLYKEIYSTNPDFLDVAQRLAQLRK